jgi:hypothetical protein
MSNSTDDQLSIRTDQLSTTPDYRDIKAKVKSAKSAAKLAEWATENVEIVSTAPTSLLNVWNPYDDHRFYRRHQAVHYGRVADTAYAKNKLISAKLERPEARVDELERTLQELARPSRALRAAEPRPWGAQPAVNGSIKCGY